VVATPLLIISAGIDMEINLLVLLQEEEIPQIIDHLIDRQAETQDQYHYKMLFG